MADTKVVKFNEQGGPLTVEIDIGQNKAATSTYFVLDETNKKLLEQDVGMKSTNIFVLKTPPGALNGTTLRWSAIIHANGDPAGQSWFVEMRASQDGNVLQDGDISNSDQFSSIVATMADEVKLQAI